MKKNCIVVETKEQGIPIGDLFGIFFEDINHAADGGLYGEMVQNRSFEFAPIDHPTYHALTAWEVIGEAEVSIEEKEPVHYNNPHYLHLRVADVALEAGTKISDIVKECTFVKVKNIHSLVMHDVGIIQHTRYQFRYGMKRTMF